MNDRGRLKLMNKINFVYGLLGFILVFQFSTQEAVKSFVLGWVISVVNFELLKRIGSLLLSLYTTGRHNPFIYLLLASKFVFWGLVLALLLKASFVEVIPFVSGTLTIIVAGLSLGVREIFYART